MLDRATSRLIDGSEASLEFNAGLISDFKGSGRMSVEHYERARYLGCPEASLNLGVIFADGSAEEKMLVESLFQEAAGAGLSSGYRNLAYISAIGRIGKGLRGCTQKPPRWVMSRRSATLR